MFSVDNFPRAVRQASMSPVLLLLLLGAPAAAAKAGTNADALSLAYNISVAGKSVYQVSYDASLSPASYGTAIEIAPSGVGKLFTDFRLNMATRGGVTNGRLQPEDFTLKSSRRRDVKSLQMTWTDGQLPKTSRTFKLPNSRATSIENALAPAISDPLTAIFRHSLENAGKPCDRRERVYNGSEVYDLRITLLGKAILDKRQGTIYQGPAFKCRVVLVPIAGYSDKRMRRYLKRPPTYTVWFAAMLAPEWGKSILVPVAGSGRFAGRNFAIVLASATAGGRALAARQ